MAYTRIAQFMPSYSYRAPVYRSAPVAYRPAFLSVPLRTYLYYNQGRVLPSAMQLNRWNMTGGYAPRSSLGNPALASRLATIDAVMRNRSMGSNKFGPFVPTYNVGALQSFRNWHATAQAASARDAMAFRNSQPGPTIYKIRPGSQARVNRGMSAYPQNKNQNTSGQGLGSYGRYGTPFINTTSSGAINRMR